MMFVDLFEEEEENPDDFLSFIIFEPSSLRIPDNDVLYVNDQVVDLFKNIIESPHFKDNIQDQILLNRLNRIDMMINLLKKTDGLVMTKFLNKIWRRYSFFSNLGELFVTKKDIHRLFPDHTFNESPILERIVEPIGDEESSDDTDDDDENDEEKDSEASDADEKEKKS